MVGELSDELGDFFGYKEAVAGFAQQTIEQYKVRRGKSKQSISKRVTVNTLRISSFKVTSLDNHEFLSKSAGQTTLVIYCKWPSILEELFSSANNSNNSYQDGN